MALYFAQKLVLFENHFPRYNRHVLETEILVARRDEHMKLRTGDPWMPAPTYGRSLHGLSLNLLVRDIVTALPFHREVLGAEVVYSDPDFAVLRHGEAEWMLHADHTYLEHPLHQSLSHGLTRGVGAELRLHGRDPDEAEAMARRLGFTVLAGAKDKPHGLREAYLLDADGYLWVPDVPRTT
jgi:catechol 2,3-dioxygenase-like lactoylglutathione lyase family enzyme